MTFDEVMDKLSAMGSEQTKKTMLRHGAVEPFFGVKIGDLKSLVKVVKKDQELALRLYESKNSDAMYLAGLSVDPKQLSKKQLQTWAEKATWYMVSEAIVAPVAAESRFALDLAMQWIASGQPLLVASGWSTYDSYVMITPDDQLDLVQVSDLLDVVQQNIHQESNRVKYCMNTFVIAVGGYVIPLHEKAKQVATQIGVVEVDMGKTACHVPHALRYIEKIESMNRVGLKKKKARC